MLLGAGLVAAAAAAPGTRLEAARDSLFLMGAPLVLVGALLQGLDWMASYTTHAQSSWDHHIPKPVSRPHRSGRKRSRRKGLFGAAVAHSGFEPSVSAVPASSVVSESGPFAAAEALASPSRNSRLRLGADTEPLQAAGPVISGPPATTPHAHPTPATSPPTQNQPLASESATAPTAGYNALVGATAAALPGAAPPTTAALATTALAAPQRPPAAAAIDEARWSAPRTEPGPDTVLEEFVGYEGQDRMMALREERPQPPRELAWPHPPRTAWVDLTPEGSEPFLDKLMDDVLARIGPATARIARVTDGAAGGAAPRPSSFGGLAAETATRPMVLAVPAPAPAPLPAAAQPVQPVQPRPPVSSPLAASTPVPSSSFRPAAPAPAVFAAPSTAPAGAPRTITSAPPPVAITPRLMPSGDAAGAGGENEPLNAATPAFWTRETLENTDHWRFAAVVEKLYQQAGFATQLQAGHTLRGVVVLWLFSRHRPGMPASVVSCVHRPGQALAVEEIATVAELVRSRDLPRGQLATTALVDHSALQQASAHGVYLMDCTRLLELIGRRSPEQQRALADRLG
jgi:hypothetical protein